MVNICMYFLLSLIWKCIYLPEELGASRPWMLTVYCTITLMIIAINLNSPEDNDLNNQETSLCLSYTRQSRQLGSNQDRLYDYTVGRALWGDRHHHERGHGAQRGEPQHPSDEQQRNVADLHPGHWPPARHHTQHSLRQRARGLDPHQPHSQSGEWLKFPWTSVEWVGSEEDTDSEAWWKTWGVLSKRVTNLWTKESKKKDTFYLLCHCT